MTTTTGNHGRPSRAAKSPPAVAAAPAERQLEKPEVESKPASVPCPRLVDDGELTRDLDRAGRLVRIVRRDQLHSGEPTILRFDPLPSAHTPMTPSRRSAPAAKRGETAPREEAAPEASVTLGQFWSWTLITIGLMAFVCGGVLLAFSLLYERDHFWRIGLPLVLGGQAALILGLVLQMEGLWHSSQQTTHTLDQLDNRLDELQHATTTLSTTHTPPAATFYAHYAQGASPHLLLADLKGQLDLLAMKMAEQRK